MVDDTRRPVVPLFLADDVEHRRIIAMRTNAALPKDGTEGMQEPLVLKEYTVATLPTASLWEGAMIYVSDEAGGAVLAFSDNTNWRRCTDRAIVS